MIDAGWKAALGLNKMQVERILVAALSAVPCQMVTDEMVDRADSVLSRSRPGIPDETIRTALATALAAMPVGEREVVRHKKRGTTYEVIARGRLQVDGDLDNEKVTIYRSLQDGAYWVRPEYEFSDGRFEVVSLATMTSDLAAENERLQAALHAKASSVGYLAIEDIDEVFTATGRKL
ncbi:hypothetical protein [Ciceribacter ferrooxidans]|uniref:hypothetical protein n=1 Tax=Ciceribacter ferrooxidans TaxID=2509717 RepID=UPI00196B1123|nr:hypothetical protein [Ciceribacter ferrooxidans]